MTQKINKIGIIVLTMILTFVMSFSGIISMSEKAHAATKITETNKLLGAGSDGKKFKNKYFDGGLREITLRKNGKASRLVYCMNANKHLDQYTNNSYSAGDAGKKMWNDLSKAAKKYIPLVCMFGYKSGQGVYKTKCDTGKKIGNRADFIAATQVLIWEFEAGARTSPTKRKSKSFYNDTLKGHSNAIKIYNGILEDIKAYQAGPSFDGNTYQQTTKDNKTWSRTIKDTSNTDGLYYKVTSAGGNTIKRSGYSYTFSRTTKKSSTVKLKPSIPAELLKQQFVVWGQTKNTTKAQALTSGSPDLKTYSVKFSTNSIQTLKIIKENKADEDAVGGWVFNVKGTNYNHNFTTNDDGVIVQNIAAGTYTITEQLTPAQLAEGYFVKPEGPQQVTIAAGETKTIKFTNDKIEKYGLKILKQTDDGQTLGGFKFNVEYPDGQIKPYTTISDIESPNYGTITIDNLDPGKYTITEVLTDEQKLHYKQPESQTIEVGGTDDEGDTDPVVVFTQTNESHKVHVKLKKTAENDHKGNHIFEITGIDRFDGSNILFPKSEVDIDDLPEDEIDSLNRETGILGMITDTTVTITIDNEDITFNRAADLSLDGIDEGDPVQIAYEGELDNGPVITNISLDSDEVEGNPDDGDEDEFDEEPGDNPDDQGNNNENNNNENNTGSGTEPSGFVQNLFNIDTVNAADDDDEADDGSDETEFASTTFLFATDENGEYDFDKIFPKGMPQGTYTIKEIQKENSRYKPNTEPVVVKAFYYENKDEAQGGNHYTVSYDNEKDEYSYTASFDNKLTEIKASKLSLFSNKELPGAYMTIYEEDGKTIALDGFGKECTWTSGNEPKIIKGLRIGKKYILAENLAPAGYQIGATCEFTIKDDGETTDMDVDTGTVQLTDEPYNVAIQKVDAKTLEPLAGAELAVYGSDGELAIDLNGEDVQFISTEEPHVVNGILSKAEQKLEADLLADDEMSIAEKYKKILEAREKDTGFTLKEISVPEGYVKAKSVNFKREESVTSESDQKEDTSNSNSQNESQTGQNTNNQSDQNNNSQSDQNTNDQSDQNSDSQTDQNKDQNKTEEYESVVNNEVSRENGVITIKMKDKPAIGIHTTATDINTQSKAAQVSKETTIRDVVELTNLVKGKEYTLKGLLMNKETNSPLLVNGEEVIVTKTFIAEESDKEDITLKIEGEEENFLSGFVTMDFTLDSSELKGVTTVVFEELTSGESPEEDPIEEGVEKDADALHADIDDEGQTVFFPKLCTTATVKELHTALSKENVTLTDKVEYSGLIPEERYKIKGVLINKKTKEPVKNTDGKEVTQEKTFTAEKAAGEEKLSFTFDASEFGDNSVVVFEELTTEEDVHITDHKDINDEGQTVHFPEIGTRATINGGKTAIVSPKTTIVDTVRYKNLIPGHTYVMKGKIVNKQKHTLAKKSQKFTPKDKNGTVKLTFTLNTSSFKESKLVAFEKVYENNKLVAIHEDINDEGQTVTIKTKDKPNPKTGDPTNWWVLGIIVALVVIAGGTIIYRKRKNSK